MARQLGQILYVLALIAVVVSVDVLFLRHNVVARLITNIGIVALFGAVWFLVFRGAGRR